MESNFQINTEPLFDTIIVDQDGVLASFVKRMIMVMNDFHKPDKPITMADVIAHKTWNLESLWGTDADGLWDAIAAEPKFWLELEAFPWASRLLQALKGFCKELVIGTAPPDRFTSAESDKKLWLATKLEPAVSPADVMIGKKKYLMANVDTLLIDDASHNTTAFVRHGGWACQVPSDWNTSDLDFDTVWAAIHETLMRRKHALEGLSQQATQTELSLGLSCT